MRDRRINSDTPARVHTQTIHRKNSTDRPPQGKVSQRRFDQNAFEDLLNQEREKRIDVEMKYQELKKSTEITSRPDLEKLNRELQSDLDKSQNENTTLREQILYSQASITHWQSEFHGVQAEREVQITAFEDAIKQQQNEMLCYIKEYHDKTRDPEHWKIDGLQKKVKALERELQLASEKHEQVKREKARADDDIRRLKLANEMSGKYIERLGKAWFAGECSPRLGRAELADQTSPSTPPWLKNVKKPDNESRSPRPIRVEQIEQREGIMAGFRKEQQRRKGEQSAVNEIVEVISRSNLGSEELGEGVSEESARVAVVQRWHGEDCVSLEVTTREKMILDGLRRRGLAL
ncbi:hypothetical protein IQ07DRAFT_643837 [Pyrenochaeta sp. DS3sAY3a]|nr:hypothetical protein IQ07DRAFT_643837 [Pyrenochaeta sp. DS3sAY3a]